MGFQEKLAKKLETYNVYSLADRQEFSRSDVYAPTGCPELDFNIGIYGFPVGISQVSGPSKVGKTTLVLTAMNNFLQQDENATAILLACEERINKTYMQRIVKAIDRVKIVRSRFLDDLFMQAQIIINDIDELWQQEKMKGKPNIFIMWDSVGSTLARAEMETFQENVKTYKKNQENGNKKEMKNAKMMDFAKSAKMYMKAMLAQIYDKNIVFVALNHIIADPNSGTGKTTPGGGWKDYMPCLHLTLKPKEWIKLDEIEVGQITTIKIEKNDFGSRRPTEIQILVNYGIVLSEADIEYAIKKKILKKETKTVISFMNGKLRWNSPRTFFQLYKDQNKFLSILTKMITAARHKDILNERNNEEEE